MSLKNLHFMRSVAVLSFLFCLRSASAQSDPFTQTDSIWHLASVAEMRAEQHEAVRYYQRLIDESAMLPLSIREWTRGTAAYCMARAAAKFADTNLVRHSIVFALEHHFWNRDLPTADPGLTNIAGVEWLDSLFAIWSSVKESEKRFWHSQPDIVWTPSDQGEKHPLIIALHGGNASFDRFAERWRMSSTELGAVIVIPPGIERLTDVTNSWGLSLSKFDEKIMAMIEKYSKRPDVDPTRVYLAGFSQGAHASLELALRHSDKIRGAIVIAGFAADTVSERSLEAASANGSRIYCITGEMEVALFKTSIIAVTEECKAHGINAHLELVPGMAHEIPLDMEAKVKNAWEWVTMQQSSASNR